MYVLPCTHVCTILQYMCASLRDCVPLIKWCRHLESPEDLLTVFDKEVEGYVKDKVLDPLCRAVEEDLRLSSHLHLQLDDRNPYKVCTYMYLCYNDVDVL